MCKASCSKIIESLYLKRETRNHPLATPTPWNMLPLLLPSNRSQLPFLTLCYFCRPSYLVKMICAAFCGVTKPHILQLPMAECSNGTSSAELGSAIEPLFPLAMRMLGCSTLPSTHPATGCSRDLRSSLLFAFLSFFLSFFGNSACSSRWMPLDRVTDLVPRRGRQVEGGR